MCVPTRATSVQPAMDDSDDLVLPWWYSWWRVALITAIVTAGLVGLGTAIVGNRSPSSDGVDVGFLQDMRSHHDQAVAMSLTFISTPDTDPVLRTIATEVLLSQQQQTGTMVEILRNFRADEENSSGEFMRWMGTPVPLEQMPGIASEADFDALANSSGAEADRMFAKLMTAHHEGGIHMADYAAAHAKESRVKSLAAGMSRAQRDEVAEMAKFLG